MLDVSTLKQIKLFGELDDQSLGFLGSHIVEKEFKAGETVCRERDPGDALYVVDSGELSVSKVIDWDDMTEKELATVGKGAFFGEMTLLDNEPRSATVRCKTDSRLLVLPRPNFWDLMNQSTLVATKLLMAIISTINARLRQTNRQFVTLYDTGKIVGSVRDLATLAEEITERVVETLLVERGLFLLQNPYNGRLEVHESFGYTVEEQALFDLKPDAGLLGEVFASRLPLRREGCDPDALAAKGAYEARSMLLVPILFNDAAIGAIFVGNKQTGEPFTNDDVVLLTGIAMQVSTAVENARNIEEREARERHHRVYITY